MAEKIISPGVFTNEIDQSFLPAAIGEIGAAVIGPTVKGPALVPTVVSSYSEFVEKFGDVFNSGSSQQTYLTSLAAKNYLKNTGQLTVVRILDGTYGTAHSFAPTGSNVLGLAGSGSSTYNWNKEASSFKIHTLADGAIMNNAPIASASDAFHGSGSKTDGFTGLNVGGHPGDFGDHTGVNNIIVGSGSKHNIRWEVSNVNKNKGTFTLLVRRGDDSIKRKQVLETWTNVNLDPNSNNYIAKVIGDSYSAIAGTESEPYITWYGEYPPKSKHIRIEVIQQTPNYLDENGNVRDSSAKDKLPGQNSGSFVGGLNGYAGFDALGNPAGTNTSTYDWFNRIGTNSQGLNPATANQGLTSYNKALNLLSNQDEYDINMILMPGLTDDNHSAVINKAIDVCEDRGDCFVIADPVAHGSALTSATTQAESYDSNYAAMYWPWVQVPDSDLGKNVWVPPSTVLGGVYAFNDKVAHPWFAPAGLNRGGLTTTVQAERKLTQSNRDDLYDSNINPIATFPGQGVVVWGQKTLQKTASALDRVNVRRLLIKVKKFIASSSRFLVFEQNTAATRRRFLNIANPFLEQVQSNSGLNAFRVVMDETNNTPDVVDRNQLYGQIFLQPTKTAEFIVLDFTVQPTGATFPE